MKVICKGKTEFLEVNVFGSNSFLNPFYINIGQIRYIREYNTKNSEKKSWAIFVGNKMFTTNEDLGLVRCIPGDIAKIGSTVFECVEATSLTDKMTCLFFINYDNVMHMRKYINEDDNSSKNDGKQVADNIGNNKFAIITVDERTIPADIKIDSHARVI